MNLDKLLEQSKKIDNLLASIFDMTLQYAESAVQDAVTDTLRDDEDNEVLYDTYCFARVHASKSSIDKFIRKKRRELSSDVLELLDTWRKHPVHWIVMRLLEPLGQDLYSMVDTITGDEFILYAPRLPEIVRDALIGKQLFVACLFFNGRCEQALDLIHFYPLLEDDLHWYVRSYRRKGSSLTQAVLDNYLDFFAIDELSEAELKQHQGEVHCVYWAEIALEKLPDTPLPGKWDCETAGDIDQLIYRGPDAGLEKITPPRMLVAENRDVKKRKLWKSVDHFYPEIYLDRENKRACIVAYSRYDFFLCRELLQLAVDENLSELSYDGKLSLPMYDFFLEQENFQLPVSPYVDSFDEDTSDVFTHFRKLVDNMLTLIENGTFDRQHLIN